MTARANAVIDYYLQASAFDAGAAAVPIAPSNEPIVFDRRYSAGDPNSIIWQSGANARGGGLASRIAALAGIGDADLSQPMPLPERWLYQDDLAQPWFHMLAGGSR